MRIELPSMQADDTPNWIDLRDRLRPGDVFAVHSAGKITSGANGETVYAPREMEDDQLNTLLGRIITAWSFQVPIPSQNSFQAADVVIDGAMDLDDYVALKKAVQPLMDKIDGKGQADPKKATDDLTQIFIYGLNGHDPKLQPKPYPPGFSHQMMIYDRFAEAYGWSPRVVDELTLDELFWLPVIRDAKTAAVQALQDKS